MGNRANSGACWMGVLVNSIVLFKGAAATDTNTQATNLLPRDTGRTRLSNSSR